MAEILGNSVNFDMNKSNEALPVAVAVTVTEENVTLPSLTNTAQDDQGTSYLPPCRFLLGSRSAVRDTWDSNAAPGQGDEEPMIISPDTSILCKKGDAPAKEESGSGQGILETNDLLKVYCNNVHAFLYKDGFECGDRGKCIFAQFASGAHYWMTPSEFEAGCGFSIRTPWSWKYSISHNGFPLEALINNGMLRSSSPDLRIQEDWAGFIDMHLQRIASPGTAPTLLNLKAPDSGEEEKRQEKQAPPMSLPFSCDPLDLTSGPKHEPLESWKNWTERIGDVIVRDFKKICGTSTNTGFEQMPNPSFLTPLALEPDHHMYQIVGMIDKLAASSISNLRPYPQAWIALGRTIDRAVIKALDLRDFFETAWSNARATWQDTSQVSQDPLAWGFEAEKIPTSSDTVQYRLRLRPTTPFDANWKEVIMKMDTNSMNTVSLDKPNQNLEKKTEENIQFPSQTALKIEKAESPSSGLENSQMTDCKITHGLFMEREGQLWKIGTRMPIPGCKCNESNNPDFSSDDIDDSSAPLLKAICEGMDLVRAIKKIPNSENNIFAWNSGFWIVNTIVTSVVGLQGYFQEMRKYFDHEKVEQEQTD